MKFVFIASDFAPKIGGIAQFMYGIISQLPSESVAAIALPTLGWKAFDEQQDFLIHRLNAPSQWAESTSHTKWMLLQYFRKLQKIPNKDMIVCCHGNLTIMMAAYMFKKRRGTPFSIFLHGLDILSARNRRSWFLYKWVLQSADLIFPNSVMIKNAALAGGVNSNAIHLIHPCVNVDDLHVNTPPDQLRQRLGLIDKFVILTVARLTEAKGIDTIIQAMPQVLKTIPNAHYVIVGEGPARLNLETLAADKKIEDYVTFLGEKAHRKIADYYAMSDLFVMTPHENQNTINVESFGIVYLEANFFGLPVIASSAGSVEDAVQHEETGLLVPPGDSLSLSKAIIRLRQDLNLSQKLVENGRQRVLKDFTSKAAARHFLKAVATHLT